MTTCHILQNTAQIYPLFNKYLLCTYYAFHVLPNFLGQIREEKRNKPVLLWNSHASRGKKQQAIDVRGGGEGGGKGEVKKMSPYVKRDRYNEKVESGKGA